MINLRALLDDDIPGIRAWPAYPEEFRDLDYAFRDGGWLDEFRSKPSAAIFLAVDGAQAVGFSLLSRDDYGGAEFRIALHPDRIGQGLGRTITLLTLARGFADPAVSAIRLIVRKNNPRAQKLYVSIPFRNTGDCIEDILGTPVPFYSMEIDRQTFYGVFQHETGIAYH